MIIIGLGSNLPGANGEQPSVNLHEALAGFPERDIAVLGVSPFYKSAPVPQSDQPWYVNAVAIIHTELDAAALMTSLHELESSFGRIRRIQNEARVLDLDLLDYNGVVSEGGGSGPSLPHPRMHTRAFVLKPLADLAPDWHHPVLGQSADTLLGALPEHGEITQLSGD